MQQHAISCVAVLGLCFGISDVVLAEDLASLREKITNNLSTIASIEVRYQVTSKSANDPRYQKFVPPGSEKPQISVWAKRGVQEFYELEPWQVPGKTQFGRILRSFDGRQFVDFHFESADAGVVTHVDVRNAPPRDAFRDSIVSKLIGLRVFETQLSLLDLLGRPGARYEGPEEIEGHLCHKIELGEYEGYTDFIRRLTIWVDPEFDYLPRKIAPYVVRKASTNKSFIFSNRTVPYVVLDFFEVEDSALGRKRWFPQKVRYSSEIETLEARINPTFSSNRFSPGIPDGARVTYWDQRVPVPTPGSTQTRVRREIVGGTAGLEAAKKRAEENALRNREAQILVNQHAEATRLRRYWAAVSGVVLLIGIVALVVWKRSRQWSR